MRNASNVKSVNRKDEKMNPKMDRNVLAATFIHRNELPIHLG